MRRALLVLLAAVAASFPTSAMAPDLASARPGAWVADGDVVYEARDALATWRGTAPLADVALRFDPADPADLELIARVRPADFDSGNVFRDANARRTVFDVADHPEATARAAADAAAGPPRATADGWTVPLAIELDLHGVAVRYAAVAQLERDGAGWIGTAAWTVSLARHGMRRPRLLGIVTEDEVRLEVRVRARPAP
jgi:polyisoprenoid-binding protein YceI